MTRVLIAIGFVSLLGQVVLLRELNVAFFGSELIYILALGQWLLWTALGAGLGALIRTLTRTQVAWLLVLTGVMLPGSVVLARGLRLLLGGVPGAYLGFGMQMAGMSLILLPIGVLLGLVFQRAARVYVTGSRTLAQAYAIECVGAILGGGLATGLAVLGFPNLSLALLAGLVACLAVLATGEGRARYARPVGGGIALLLLVGLYCGPSCDTALTRWNHPHLVFSKDTPYGRVTASEREGQAAVFLNDALIFESGGTSAEEFIQLATLQHPRPQRILIIGGGLEGLAEEAARLAGCRIYQLEISSAFAALNSELTGLLRRPQDIPRLDPLQGPSKVDRLVGDPRRFLAKTASFDLILVAMPEPASAQMNRYYTREFFSLCARALAPGGVLAFRLRGAENFWTRRQTLRAASIHRSLRDAFADVVVLPGAVNFFLASDSSLTRDPEVLANRLAERGIRTRLITAPYLEYLYTNDRFAQTAALVTETRSQANTDMRPVCFHHTLLLRLSRFFPPLASWEGSAPLRGTAWSGAWVWLCGAAAAAGLLLVRRARRTRRIGLALLIGATGLVWETVLILNYQVRSGLLFQNLGLLLTLFMTGLVLGSAGGSWYLTRPGAGCDRSRWFGRSLWLLFLAGGLLLSRPAALAATGDLLSTGSLLLVGGFLVAAIFAQVSLHERPDQGRILGPVYAADLLGAGLASLGTGLFLVPVLGLAGAAVGVTVLCVAALLLEG